MNTPKKILFNSKNFNTKDDNLFSLFLHFCGQENISSQDLAQALKALVNCELKEGGPYRDEGRKTDLGFNVLIAYFLFKQGVNLPSLDKLIDKAILNKDFASQYFTKPEVIIYLAALVYKGTKKDKLIAYLKEQKDNILIKEALNICLNKNTHPKRPTNKEDDEFLKVILREADNRFKNFPLEFKKMALAQINRTISANKDRQMSLMPYYFKKALGQKGRILNDSLIAKLGLVNIFFWTAFIIYDDFWDEDEKADPKILPIANLFARDYINLFNSILPNNPDFPAFFHNLMDKLDVANNWETIYCRTKVKNNIFYIPDALPDYQDYSKKFEPASGHVLGSLVLLLKIGCKLNTPEVNNLIFYFKNYLIAMQLNDDAHDWLEDFERGHLSTVVVMMLKDWQEKYPKSQTIDLKNDLEKLQKLFWFKTLKKSCAVTITYTKKAQQALSKMDYIEHKEYLSRFISMSEKVAKDALLEQEKSVNFLKSF